MSINSIGDQARAFALQAASGRIKNTLAVLSKELSTGESSDIPTRLRGNTQQLSDITSRLATLSQLKKNATEIKTQADGMMTAMEAVRTSTDELSVTLTTQPLIASEDLIALHASNAAGTFDSVVSRLNVSMGGRYFFSGLESNRPPLASAGQMLDTLEQLTSGMTSAAQIATAVSDWFDAPRGAGAFMDIGYSGSVGQAQALPIGEDIVVQLPLNAASPELREHLKGLAIAALVYRGIPADDLSQRRELLRRGGEAMAQNAHNLTAAIGQLGFRQALIERAQTESNAGIATLEIMRNDITQADPYATSAALSEAETHLQTLYAVTARLSKLRLVEFLR